MHIVSYIEKKYRTKISETFEQLVSLEKDLLNLFELKSINKADEIAKVCADFNKKINLILKKYYPEIKDIKDKLNIKSYLKFYYDLIDKLSDFIRNIENFQKIDDNYYNSFIEFINDKDDLINGKYREICTNELTVFYDQKSRENLERILADKFAKNERRFFAMGPLEEEIKKIAKIAGANEVTIFPAHKILEDTNLISHPNSVINYAILTDDKDKLKEIGNEIKQFLLSKGYEAIVFSGELTNLDTDKEALTGSVITTAKLLPDI